MKHTAMFITATILALVTLGSALAMGVFSGPFASKEQATQASSDPILYNTLGYQLAQEGKGAEAQVAFAKAVSLKSDYENARSNLATISFQNKDYMTAIEQLRWLVAKQPGNADYKFDLAQNLVSQARYIDGDLAKLDEGASIYESLGTYPHASENAKIVRNVIADVS